jgi:hypothetical protein
MVEVFKPINEYLSKKITDPANRGDINDAIKLAQASFDKNRTQLEIKNNTAVARILNRIADLINKALDTDIHYRSKKAVRQSKHVQTLFGKSQQSVDSPAEPSKLKKT